MDLGRISIVVAIIAIILGAANLAYVSSLSAQTVQISDLSSQVEKLSGEAKKLSTEVGRVRAELAKPTPSPAPAPAPPPKPAPAPSPAKPLKTVKVGILKVMNVAPIWLAEKKGWFRDEGIKLEKVYMAGGAVILPAVAGGSVDIGMTNVFSFILARDKGFDFFMIASNVHDYKRSMTPEQEAAAGHAGTLGYRGLTTAIVVQPGIKSIKDLAGKTIAVNTLNNINHLSMLEILKKNGVDPKEVTFIEIAFPKMPPAIVKKQVDAATVAEPFLTVLKEQGFKVLDYNLLHVSSPVEIVGFVAKESWIKDNADLVERWTRAYYKALDYMPTHEQEVTDVVLENTPIKPAIVKKLPIDLMVKSFRNYVSTDDLFMWIELAQKYNLLKKTYTQSEMAEWLYKTAKQ